jgi:predicted nucleotide-binding protein
VTDGAATPDAQDTVKRLEAFVDGLRNLAEGWEVSQRTSAAGREAEKRRQALVRESGWVASIHERVEPGRKFMISLYPGAEPLDAFDVALRPQSLGSNRGWARSLADHVTRLVSKIEADPSVLAPRSPTGGGARPIATGSRKVFVVHGHDHGARETVARFLEKIGLEPVILEEQAGKGRTIIEKFEDHAGEDIRFAVVILTGDDRGGPLAQQREDQRRRARQNVVFELGYFVGVLGRSHVCALHQQDVELPSDYAGVEYVSLDARDWQFKLAREIDAAGVTVDFNRLK